MSQTFTIAICTRNRTAFLCCCLDALLIANAGIDAPIIVIDNNSTDETQATLATYTDRITVAREECTGLSHARNKAIDLCRTPYLVFLDDDGVPDRGWATAVRDLIDSFEPDVFGGPYSPFYTGPKPNWFTDSLGTAHADLSDGRQSRNVCFSGGNMGWRLDLLKALGGFDPKLGIVGNKLRLGEETALQLAIWRQNPDATFCFSKAMHMIHHVSREKMRLRYVHKRNFIYGWQLIDIDPSLPLVQSRWWRLMMTTKLGSPILLRMIIRDRARYPAWKTYVAAYLSYNSILMGVAARQLNDWLRVNTHGLPEPQVGRVQT